MKQDIFRLKAIKAAKVSEISEATAAAPVPDKERVNFHIGHPLQDRRLTAYFRQLVFNALHPSQTADEKSFRAFLEEEGIKGVLAEQALFVFNTIPHCNPYMPRGGYAWRKPSLLVKMIKEWFEQRQLEPIVYDTGEQSQQKELMLGSGGVWESLRVLFFTLNRFLEARPARILTFRLDLPEHLKNFEHLQVVPLPGLEEEAVAQIEKLIEQQRQTPHFLVIGVILEEETRRQLRRLSLNRPLFFVEANDAPNHLSLAREALLDQRVLRILTPAAFDKRLSALSTVVVAGRADYIRHLETVHFELKGTPAAAEVELLRFFLEQQKNDLAPVIVKSQETQSNVPEFSTVTSLTQTVTSFTHRLQKTAFHLETWLAQKKPHFLSNSLPAGSVQADDSFALRPVWELVQQFFASVTDKAWVAQLQRNFLAAFATVHPEYDVQSCLAVSGSARTALSLLGFHGPLRAAVTFDLGWTYEHCFPEVHILPYSPLEIKEAHSVIEDLRRFLQERPELKGRCAFVLNNPHNATGAVLDEGIVKAIVSAALRLGFYVIDDLSYQNVGPWSKRRQIPSGKQLVRQLLRNGELTRAQADRLITCHSLSKTDSFAGARLTVLEVPPETLRLQVERQLSFVENHALALFIAYLFYRSGKEAVENYWNFRNKIFAERLQNLERAVHDLPRERNVFEIVLRPPAGSMYPLLIIKQLPEGISLDALSSQLANQGIGLIPLSAFARTAEGFTRARNAFRLSLGGAVDGERLYYQMRRVLIDLNRLIAQQAAQLQAPALKVPISISSDPAVENLALQVEQAARQRFFKTLKKKGREKDCASVFEHEFLPQRLHTLKTLWQNRLQLWHWWQKLEGANLRQRLSERLENEFFKDDLSTRQQRFRQRLFDRTVHPTQIYALKVESQARALNEKLILKQPILKSEIQTLAEHLLNEFWGENVAINSIDEAQELLLDLDAFIEAEMLAEQAGENDLQTFLSFWGDWDGSTRPSGQGHRLVAAVLVENVSRLAAILNTLLQLEPGLKIDEALKKDLQQLPGQRQQFWKLLNEITHLTNQLEKRFRSLMPVTLRPSTWRRLGMKFRLLSDPFTVVWQHNDRLERKMVQLRQQRREGLEFYFLLNKRLRKALKKVIPQLMKHLDNAELFYRLVSYRDLLKRFVLTPRIHQSLITSTDSFAIDTTVFNIQEINALGAQVGNPGLILALQVSMTDRSEALIRLDQKLNARREALLRKAQELDLPPIWIVPLFEEFAVVQNIESFLEALWNYAKSYRSSFQSVEERFSQMICEIFIAGSDLSQQVSQPVAAQLYRETRFKVVKWLAAKSLLTRVRLKLGSGEPMQRQGGFYDSIGGKPAFLNDRQSTQRLQRYLSSSASASARFAVTPLRGVLSSGDLRTLQSTISEKLRMVDVAQRANFLFHLKNLQTYHRNELIRAGEPLTHTRLRYGERSEKELRRLTLGWPDPLLERFLNILQENFRQIVYGREEDVVGIHVVSYFISRMVPAFRDRPTIRPAKSNGKEQGQRVIQRLSRVLPLARHGTMLRAIGHNRAQTMILGVNQLTTGLFRALKQLADEQQTFSDARLLLSERVLPFLPVYEILNGLRLYQDTDLRFFKRLEHLFPAGNSAVGALHEDMELMYEFIPLLQAELLRRHGLSVGAFLENGCFKADLLPALRPDLAVLLQKNLFNTEFEAMGFGKNASVSTDWQVEVRLLLRHPRTIARWREKIWDLIEEKIAVQVESFVQLALAISVLLRNGQSEGFNLEQQIGRFQKTASQLSSSLQNVGDDNLRQFLLAALEYLAQTPRGGSELPVNVMRALRDVERIVKIEQQPLSSEDQARLRFYILQIARLTGENG